MYLKVFRILFFIVPAFVLISVVLRWSSGTDLIGDTWLTALVIILIVANAVELYKDETSGNKLAYFYFMASGLLTGFLIYEVLVV